MSRSERLLNLLQVLRHHRRPVTGQALSAELGVSIRTLYRDIASLKAQGAVIEGEPGLGYVMKPGFMLPPLMFAAEELDALVLGMRLIAEQGDHSLAQGASRALDKIYAVLPAELRRELEASALLVGAGHKVPAQAVDADVLRTAIRTGHKLELSYRTPAGAVSERTVWPFALVYFDLTRVLMCWCELRGHSAIPAPIVSSLPNCSAPDRPEAGRHCLLNGVVLNTSPATASCPSSPAACADRQVVADRSRLQHGQRAACRPRCAQRCCRRAPRCRTASSSCPSTSQHYRLPLANIIRTGRETRSRPVMRGC